MRLPDRPLVKICGMRSVEIAQAANDAGADLIGFVFAPSRRQVSAEQAKAIVDGTTGRAVPVGLFVDDSVENINATARSAGIRLLQIHWRASDDDLKRFELPYYLVRRTDPGATYDDVAPDLERVLGLPTPPLWIMVDAYHPTQSGGTGLLADWDLSTRLARTFPLMLAGGLNPENVAEAIERVQPAHVDVSSGVEIAGEKSAERIGSFVANARTAFDRYASSSASSSSETTIHS